MGRFTTAPLPPPAPPAGIHVAKIIRAKETLSEAGNSVLRMQARFPGGEELPFAITFVPQAARVVGFFCRSLDLELPGGDGVEVEIKPADVLGRYFFPVVEIDGQGVEAVAKIVRFLSRTEAIAARPELAGIKLQSQTPHTLKPITGGDRL
jgi:hypothetical protein